MCRFMKLYTTKKNAFRFKICGVLFYVLHGTWLITQGFARRMQNGDAYAFFYRRFIQLIGLVLAMKTDGITCPPIGNFIGTTDCRLQKKVG